MIWKKVKTFEEMMYFVFMVSLYISILIFVAHEFIFSFIPFVLGE